MLMPSNSTICTLPGPGERELLEANHHPQEHIKLPTAHSSEFLTTQKLSFRYHTDSSANPPYPE